VSITAGQQFVLEAQGDIASSRTSGSPSTWVNYWESVSRIGTTQWPTATTATVYHPGVNFLVQLPTSTAGSGSGSGSNSTSSASSFSLFALSLGGSIGVLVVIAIAALCGIGCLFALIRCLMGRRRRQPPPGPPVAYQNQPVAQYPPPQGPYSGPPPYGPGSPPHPAQYNMQPSIYQMKGPDTTSQAV
jgi:hypothetical protein